jgi:hypothetical protein
MPVAPPRPEPTRALPAAPRRPGPGAAALPVRGRFTRHGLHLGVLLGVRLRPRLVVAAVVALGSLVTSASTGPGGAPVGGATVVVRAGRAVASFWRALLACSLATFTAWRPRLETASSQRAGQDRPAVATTACALSYGATCVFAGTSRPPPASRPADWVALLFPPVRQERNERGPMAWRQPGKPRPPPTRRPASTPPSPPECWPGLRGRRWAGAAERADDRTPSIRSRREPGCRQGPQPCHRHGPDPPRAACHGRVAWAIALSPVADVGPARLDASPRQRAPGPARAAAGPRPRRRPPRHRAGRGSGAPVERLAPRRDLTPLPDPPSLCGWPAAPTSAITPHRPDGPDKAVSNRRRGGSQCG